MARRRAPASYGRKAPKREPYPLVAIVCEGTKTEPRYFEGLRRAYRLSSANIRITPASGTDSLSVVNYGEELLESGEFEYAYCVFDRNGHTTWDAALEKVRTSALGERLVAVPSWPCFEVWLLLHFRYSNASFERAGNRSPCDQVIAALKTHLPKYRKAQADIFAVLRDHLPVGIRNAARLCADNARTGSQNPSTKLHTLVSYLRALKPQ